MKQLLLEWGIDSPQTLDTFVVGTNAELTQLLQGLGSRVYASASEKFIYLWGNPGAGKTHLLRALSLLPAARYIGADAAEEAFLHHPDCHVYLLDDCDKLSDESQIAAFALFNQVREHNAMMIAAGATAPANLSVREDLRTRLGWGLVYQVHELTDEEKIAALMQTAKARGLTLSSAVLPYLITHFKRDMRSLSTLLNALDHYSLETQRPITLPLLRNLLQLEKEIKA